MTKDRIIIIREYSSEFDAAIAQEHLSAHDVVSFVSKDDAGGMRPHLQLTMGVRLLVHERDKERAEEILEAMESGAE